MAIFIWPRTPIDTTGLATEATLLQVETNTSDTVNELQDVNSELNAQSTTLSSIDSKVLTDAQLRATPVPVSGPLTDAELRATAVPVSGPLTDTELRASAVPVSAASLPLPTGAATEATLAALAAEDFATQTTLSAVNSAVSALNDRVAGSLVPEEFDYQDISYVLAGNGIGEISTVVYKLGGSGGTTVATLTMTYDANDRLATVTRS